MKSTERFSDRVDNYVRYRPHYPEGIVSFLEKTIGFDSGWVVADVGSGTGISTETFLGNGNVVYAVEPNKEMRKAAEGIHKGDKKFISVNGTAEATSLRSNSIDLIVCGQAFHWFNKDEAKKEFVRIAEQEAYLLLMWNERSMDSKFQKAYEQMLVELAPAYEEKCQYQIDEKAIKEFFAPNKYNLKEFPNAQYFDFEGLKGRLLSCSYAPLEKDPHYKPLMAKLTQVFDEFSTNGKVTYEYRCKLYYGQIK
jgi:ubiquinone/menaquinone biosynthesis C-methylase UbiE